MAKLIIYNVLQVSGKREIVEQFIKDKNVIHEVEIAGVKTALLYGERYKREAVVALGLEVEKCNVQQLMVYSRKTS